MTKLQEKAAKIKEEKKTLESPDLKKLKPAFIGSVKQLTDDGESESANYSSANDVNDSHREQMEHHNLIENKVSDMVKLDFSKLKGANRTGRSEV